MKKLKNLPVESNEVSEEIVKPDVLAKLRSEANGPAKQTFRFSTTQVQLITYMMDKHGMDFKAMARDPKNHYQETPAKLKGMVTKFISIPEHYAPYCTSRGLISVPENDQPDIVGSESDSDEADDQDDGVDITEDLE